MTKERSIIMNTAMVQAILDGRKTQTRRVVKFPKDYKWHEKEGFGSVGDDIKCPYEIGMKLWVRETWQKVDNEIFYKAGFEHSEGVKWKPSIHMPRWASIILLEITDIHVERLQDISEEDAKKEGIGNTDTITVSEHTTKTYKQAFGIYWRNVHVGRWKNKKHKGDSCWDKNPLVWVIEFKGVEVI